MEGLSDKYNVQDPDEQERKKIKHAEYKLLEAIANALGYKDKITWETIQNPYMPKGMADQIETQKRMQQTYQSVLDNVNNVVQRQEQKVK